MCTTKINFLYFGQTFVYKHAWKLMLVLTKEWQFMGFSTAGQQSSTHCTCADANTVRMPDNLFFVSMGCSQTKIYRQYWTNLWPPLVSYIAVGFYLHHFFPLSTRILYLIREPPIPLPDCVQPSQLVGIPRQSELTGLIFSGETRAGALRAPLSVWLRFPWNETFFFGRVWVNYRFTFIPQNVEQWLISLYAD